MADNSQAVYHVVSIFVPVIQSFNRMELPMSKVYGVDDKELEDLSIPIHDLLNGYLKNAMYEAELELTPYLENISEVGSGENFEEQLQRRELTGCMDAYVQIYSTLTSLIFERDAITNGK